MEKPDVTLTEMDGIIRVTFNTPVAISIANDEPEIANYIMRKDNFVFLDIAKGTKNRNNMIMFCVSHNLKTISE